MARLSKVLVTLKDDVPVEVPLEQLGVSDPDPAPLLAFLTEMEFRTLTTRVAQTLGVEGAPPVSSSAGGQALSKALAANGGGEGSDRDGGDQWRAGEASHRVAPEREAIRSRRL